MVPVDVLRGLQGVLYDADQGDVSPGHGVVLVRPEDVGPGHDDGEVVVVGEAARGGRHLTDVHSLVPLIDELDGEGPVVVSGRVPDGEPLVLGEGAGPGAEDVPVSQPDPGDLHESFDKIKSVDNPLKSLW